MGDSLSYEYTYETQTYDSLDEDKSASRGFKYNESIGGSDSVDKRANSIDEYRQT